MCCYGPNREPTIRFRWSPREIQAGTSCTARKLSDRILARGPRACPLDLLDMVNYGNPRWFVARHGNNDIIDVSQIGIGQSPAIKRPMDAGLIVTEEFDHYP